MQTIMAISWLPGHRAFPGGLHIGEPRRPARVELSIFDVRIVTGSRERSGDD